SDLPPTPARTGEPGRQGSESSDRRARRFDPCEFTSCLNRIPPILYVGCRIHPCQSVSPSFIKVATKMSQKRKAGKSAVAEIGACQSGFPGRAAKNALGSGYS